MTDGFRPDGIDAVPVKAAEAAAALEALKEPAERAAASIEDAFGRAGASLTRSLTRAAADGEVTLAELARAVLNAVNAAALSGFGGARADGGPVLGGGAYLRARTGGVPPGGRRDDRAHGRGDRGDGQRHGGRRGRGAVAVRDADRADAGEGDGVGRALKS